MNQLKDAIDKATAEQYPAGVPKPATFLHYSKGEKKSQRQRWVDHFTLQLKAEGFRILDFATYKGSTFDQTTDFKKLVVSEFRFHPIRLWRFDFAIPGYKLAIEVDGGVWRAGGGAHSHPSNIMRDIEKSNAATISGWHLLRFTDREIRSTDSIRLTKEFISVQSLRQEPLR